MNTYSIKYEANKRVIHTSEFTVRAVDRNEALRKALEVEKPNTRLVRIYLDGVELFGNF